MKTRALFLVAALAGAAASSSGTLQAADQQCYRNLWEPEGTCSTCSNTCLGGPYKCCRIIIVDN
ncbi:MAG TPA: hypothetical protein VFQ45_05315 [Longimicrobium sp.]|nr:hypothetical protein [Longimicrobium sp.]